MWEEVCWKWAFKGSIQMRVPSCVPCGKNLILVILELTNTLSEWTLLVKNLLKHSHKAETNDKFVTKNILFGLLCV